MFGMSNQHPRPDIAAEPPHIEWTPGELLRKARNTAKVSPEVMAAELGVSIKTVGNYEHDRTKPPKSARRRYAELAGWDFSGFEVLFEQAVRSMRWFTERPAPCAA